MRSLRLPLFILGAWCALVSSLFGQTVRVLSVSGEATIQIPGEAEPRTVRKGDTIVVGTRIITGEGARVIITPLPGVNSIIAPKSDVVIERVSVTREPGVADSLHSAVLDLRTGAVTTDLRKTEGVALDYGVRTARGLAGARGTTYTIGVNAAGVQTVVVADGVISLTLTDGRVVSLLPGQVSITRPDGTSQAVASARELSTADGAIADNWVETTLDSLAEAVDQGIDIDPAALEDAVRSALSLEIDIDEDTQAKLDRARQRQKERRERESGDDGKDDGKKVTLQEKLEDSGGDDGSDERDDSGQEVNTQEQQASGGSSAFDFAVFIRTFPTDAQTEFFGLGSGARVQLSSFIGRLTSDSDRRTALLFALDLPSTSVLGAYLGRSDSLKTYLARRASDTQLTGFALYPYSETTDYPSEAAVVYYGRLNATERDIFYEFSPEVQARVAAATDEQVADYAFDSFDGRSHSSSEVEYFLNLTVRQREAFLELPEDAQAELAYRNLPALTTYILTAGRTEEQAAYALSLESDVQLSAFLALPATLQGKLVDADDPALTNYALNGSHTTAEISFAANLSSDRRSVFFALSSTTQALLVAKAADADFLDYALDTFGEGETRPEANIIFFAGLNLAQREQFLDLDNVDQDALIAAANPTLTTYALAVGRSADEARYVINLGADRFAAFLTLGTAARDALVDGADDAALQDFAYGTGTTPRASATIVYFKNLNDGDRALFLLRAAALQDAAPGDEAFEDLLLAEVSTGVFEYSDAVLLHYLQLPSSLVDEFLASSSALREEFALVDRPGLTAAILTPGTFDSTPAEADLLRNLAALRALSPANQDLFETFAGGPTYSKLDSTPSPLDWSDAAWTRTGKSFTALPSATQTRILSLGAIEGLFDYSGTFIEAAFADYDSSLATSARTAANAAGWGRDFASYFADDGVRAVFAAAANFTTAQLAVLKQFEVSPQAFVEFPDATATATLALGTGANPGSRPDAAQVRANLAVLAALPATDRALLLSLDAGDDILFATGAGYFDNDENFIVPTYAETLTDALDLARRFSSEDLSTLVSLGLGHAILENRDGGTINVSEDVVDVRDHLRELVDLFESLTPAQQDAALDTGILGSTHLSDFRLVDGVSVAAALDAWLALAPATRDFLAGEAGGDFSLLDLVDNNDIYRELGQIDALISSLTPAELATLRDLEAGEFILNLNFTGGLISSTDLKAFLAYAGTLTDPQFFAMRELGILDDRNHRTGLFASDQAGLTRLLQAYAELDRADADPEIGNVVVATRQADPYANNTVFTGRSFFFASDDGNDFVTYNVGFISPGNLYIGATRRLALFGTAGALGATFTVPAGKDVALRASTLIDLDTVSFSAGVRAITLEAATINLANLDFPEGSVVSLNSKLGGTGTGNRYPNFGPSIPGRVNFIDAVSYGGSPMFDESTFDSASRGNISIGTLQNRAPLPTYQPAVSESPRP